MPIEVIVRPIPGLAEVVAERVLAAFQEAKREGRPLALAVPGGSVAEAFFPRLVKLPLDWRRVLVFFVDERAVRPDADDANVRLARELWLDRVPIPLENVHRMQGEEPDLEGAARNYARVLKDALGAPPRFDLVLLGMGADGHVASLFPGSPGLDESERFVLAVEGAPKPPPRRLTLSLPALAAGRSLMLAAFGASKAAALATAVEDQASASPAARVLRAGPRAAVLLDPEAAAALPQRPAER